MLTKIWNGCQILVFFQIPNSAGCSILNEFLSDAWKGFLSTEKNQRFFCTNGCDFLVTTGVIGRVLLVLATSYSQILVLIKTKIKILNFWIPGHSLSFSLFLLNPLNHFPILPLKDGPHPILLMESLGLIFPKVLLAWTNKTNPVSMPVAASRCRKTTVVKVDGYWDVHVIALYK